MGKALAEALPKYTNDIRLVSRNPERINESDELISADLTNPEETKKAVEGSETVYLTIGLKYDASVWQRDWPIVVENVLNACKSHNSKLVFFDNVYMYDPTSIGFMTEENPINPSSKKGKVRAQIAQKIMDASAQGEVEALIARSADFYGPGVKEVSILQETIFNPLKEGKKANVLGNAHAKHSFTYIPDAGKATAMLGNTQDCYNQVWHLPTASNPMAFKEFVDVIAPYFGAKPKYQVAGKLLTRLIGLFVPVMKEIPEMIYQYESDYIFSSQKFEDQFDFTPTSYLEGIREIMRIDFGKS